MRVSETKGQTMIKILLPALAVLIMGTSVGVAEAEASSRAWKQDRSHNSRHYDNDRRDHRTYSKRDNRRSHHNNRQDHDKFKPRVYYHPYYPIRSLTPTRSRYYY